MSRRPRQGEQTRSLPRSQAATGSATLMLPTVGHWRSAAICAYLDEAFPKSRCSTSPQVKAPHHLLWEPPHGARGIWAVMEGIRKQGRPA